MSTTREQRPRVLFFGMQCDFSIPSLQALLDSDIDVCAVVIPVSPIPGLKQLPIKRREQPQSIRSALPLLPFHFSIAHMAWRLSIPVWEVRDVLDALTYSTLAAYETDIICVACFSRRLPRSLLTLPRLGCLNVHPSLLPKNRGPVPLFWTFRHGEHRTGVTIHFLDETMDTGDILAQESIEVPGGISYMHLEQQCAKLGGTLLANVVHDVYKGRMKRIVQDLAKSTYYSYPSVEDFSVSSEESDGHFLYNFINGIGYWNEPVEIHTRNQTFFTRECISYSRENGGYSLERLSTMNTQEIHLPCRDGWVKIRLLE